MEVTVTHSRVSTSRGLGVSFGEGETLTDIYENCCAKNSFSVVVDVGGGQVCEGENGGFEFLVVFGFGFKEDVCFFGFDGGGSGGDVGDGVVQKGEPPSF